VEARLGMGEIAPTQQKVHKNNLTIEPSALKTVSLYCIFLKELLIWMSKKNQLAKICPECEEEMNPIYDKAKVLVCWECSECGTRVLTNKNTTQ
jgi:hypothetical protein